MPNRNYFVPLHRKIKTIEIMPYPSIDELQRTLSGTVFQHTLDAKKAAGRALGTLIEIITYYLLNEWGITDSLAIERGIEEYGNAEITHNVEFSVHPVVNTQTISIEFDKRLSAKKIAQELQIDDTFSIKTHYLIDNSIIKNACIIAENQEIMILAELLNIQDQNQANIKIVYQSKKPYAMFECKRVGVEEGAKKGPQTIEKAKQGAYVAKTTSALQKVRGENGDIMGLIYQNGEPIIKPYFELLHEIIHDSQCIPASFMLSIGVVSNHGNWFTAENQNKELKVLAQSYDWLLFLSDQGLAQFITELLLEPQEQYLPIKYAFLESYKEGKKQNMFTKVKMSIEAHYALINYFHNKRQQIEQWFNIISPNQQTLENLKDNLNTLIAKIN